MAGPDSTAPDFETNPRATSPLEIENLDEISKNLRDIVSQRLFDDANYNEIKTSDQYNVDVFLKTFAYVAENIDQVIQNLDNNTLTTQQKYVLGFLTENEEMKELFINRYAGALSAAGEQKNDANREGYKLYLALDKYKKYVTDNANPDSKGPLEDLIAAQLADGILGDFKLFFDHLYTRETIQKQLKIGGSKFRNDTPPPEIAIWQCRIGASTFYVPPTSINVHQSFKTSSVSGAALRQKNSSKINMGHAETLISMTIYFPTHETIWGFDGDSAKMQFHDWDPQSNAIQTGTKETSDSVIDTYLSSLRGLITQFKYAPFLPVRNQYLNRTHDITAVGLRNMTVSTVEGFPFVAAVNLEMVKFNFKPFMPMIDHFDQAIHWGKFRQYIGRAAVELDRSVNKGFLIEKDVSTNPEDGGPSGTSRQKSVVIEENSFGVPLNKVRDINEGKNFDLYFPLGTPTKIYTGDVSDFRQPGEDEFFTTSYWGSILDGLGLDPVDAPNFLFSEYDKQRNSYVSERDILRSWLKKNQLTWEAMNSDNFDDFVARTIKQADEDGSYNGSNKVEYEKRLRSEWFYVLFDEILTNDPIFAKIKKARESLQDSYLIKEWEVPMAKAPIDWSKCIVRGVAVSLSNSFAQLQVQLQEEPTYQHIGGGDSHIDVEMTVIGEDNLIGLRRVFQHISGLARLERQHGVLGFLGVKNIFTALCGIKYCLPLRFDVETKEGYPNVYDVRLSFVDFDVMQQKRESLDSSVQKDLIDHFGKRNPFLRIKQSWGAISCYPDFPLDIRGNDGKIIGHLDPDWYFRSFKKKNEDLIHWKVSKEVLSLIQEYSEIELGMQNDSEHRSLRQKRLEDIRVALIEADRNKSIFPPGWEIGEDNGLKLITKKESYDPEERELRFFLGSYGEDQGKSAILDIFAGGVFRLGELDNGGPGDQEPTYVGGYNTFSEDLASKNTRNAGTVASTSPLHQYQTEYLNGEEDPGSTYEAIFQDWDYRNISGRMIKAFPTYMLWLIDEGGHFAGIKLFDNLYGLNSIIDFSVSSSADDPISDTLVLRLSNTYEKLTRSYSESIISEDDPLAGTITGIAIKTFENRYKNIQSGLYDNLVEIDNIRLKPGVRIHLRAGYSSNVNSLQTIFNGTITEVSAGQIMTVVAQSDAVELSSFVNTESASGHSGTIDGAIHNFWLSEPRDLIVRLLSMGSSNFKEWLAWGTRGVVFSESRFGIRHFGNILYEPMTESESQGHFNQQVIANSEYNSTGTRDISGASYTSAGLMGEDLKNLSELTATSVIAAPSTAYGIVKNITNAMFFASTTRRDYEIYKRNIYPGNGTGLAQFMGGDLIDAGILLTQAETYYEGDKSVASMDPSYTRNPEQGGPAGTREAIGDLGGTSNSADVSSGQIADNTTTIVSFWDKYYNETGLSEEELISFLSNPSQTVLSVEASIDSSVLPNRGILNSITDAVSLPFETVNWVSDQVSAALDHVPGVGGVLSSLSNLVKGGFINFPFATTISVLKNTGKAWNGLGRFASSPLGITLGLGQAVNDDDLEGFNEVSFRAQTYMKTVWDLFEVCAALLPNYIVAVRPFEDRSTLFYGKPHWLYTSGVIPVTTGVQSDFQTKPHLDPPDELLNSFLQTANSLNQNTQRLLDVAKGANELKDIDAFLLANADPYNVSSVVDGALLVNESIIAEIFSKASAVSEDVDPLEGFRAVDYSLLTAVEVSELAQFSRVLTAGSYDIAISAFDSVADLGINSEGKEKLREILSSSVSAKKEDKQGLFNNLVSTYITYRKISLDSGSNLNNDTFHAWDELIKQINEELIDGILLPQEGIGLINLLRSDPVTFAYQFGWRFSRVPVWIGPEANAGYDIFGELARQKWSNDANASPIGGNDGVNDDDAFDIWLDFRNRIRYAPEIQDAFIRYFPQDEAQTKFDGVVDAFLRFLWQDPYNRAWVTLTASKLATGWLTEAEVNLLPGLFGIRDEKWDGVDFLTGEKVTIHIGGNQWNFSSAFQAFEIFLSSKDIGYDQSGVPISPKTKSWMRSHAQQGKNSGTVAGRVSEDIGDWWDANIGQVLSVVIDSITGLTAAIRISLAQLSDSLEKSGDFQRQSNVLNSLLNDSLYYQAGEPGDFIRLVDNCFTREYGEPVIEVREPFQRVHMVSSFDTILDNQIRENLNDVATIVTAVSDGKNPVTVHLDKGISPDRQIEKVVETGLYFDNISSGGFFGFLQPLIHPMQAIRSVKKFTNGSSDELSARRVALYHLKNSIKNIYEGEIIILGNPDIRTWDLLYISDNYSRIFGMVECGQVIHHFTPETGFITSITPSALVSINDPARWSYTSYMWSKMTNATMRDEMRALMNINTERFITMGSDNYTEENGVISIPEEDLYNQFSDHLAGSVQWTQGNSSIIKDLGAMWAGGGISGLSARDDIWNKAASIDLGLGVANTIATIGGAVVGGVVGTGVPGVVAGGVTGITAGQLAWKAWGWVKDNLLDQHGCLPPGKFVLTKNGLKEIETIKPGEEVYTHRGRWRPVTHVMEREVDETMYSIITDKLRGMSLEVTGEHPLLVFRGDKEVEEPEWVPAKFVRKHDYIVINPKRDSLNEYVQFDMADYVKPEWVVTDDSVYAKNHPSKAIKRHLDITEDFAYAIGFYLGDGYVYTEGKESDPRGINFSFDKRDLEGIERIRRIFKEQFGIDHMKPKVSEDSNQYSVNYASSAIGRWLKAEFGCYFDTKKMPEWVFGLSQRHKEMMLAGLMESDGCRSNDSHKIQLTNRQLSYDVFQLLIDIDSYPSINGGVIQKGGTAPHYVVAVRSAEIPGVIDQMNSRKGLIGGKRINKARFKTINGYTGYRISDILERRYHGMVYNLSVAEDNSYVAEGQVVHNCYIQFLNKDGQAMDAGLSYFQGNAVGSNHLLSLFPNIMGISSPKKTIRKDGHYRITTNDLLAKLGWTELETTALHRETSMFVDNINSEVLKLAGRGPDSSAVDTNNYYWAIAEIIAVAGEGIGEFTDDGTEIFKNGIIDGDTIDVRILGDVKDKDGKVSIYSGIERIRLSAVDTYELQYKNNAYTDFNETVHNAGNDLGKLAYDYLATKFAIDDETRIIGIRVNPLEGDDGRDRTGSKRLLGTVFHNVPANSSERIPALLRLIQANPPIPWGSYLSDGRPYTLNWEMVMTGYGNVDMRDSNWDNDWRFNAWETF